MQPPTFNPGYNPQAPVSQGPPVPSQQQFIAPQSYPPSQGDPQPIPPPSLYQNTGPRPSMKKSSGGNLFKSFKNKVSVFGVGAFVSIVFVTLLVSSSSTYFIMGGTLFSNENPDEFLGKWYGPRNYDHIQIKEDGTLLEWDQPRFACISYGETISADYVNDGDEDCEDGSDEDTYRANTFDSSYQWIAPYAYSQTNDVDFEWRYVDDELCFQLTESQSLIGSSIVFSCRRAEIVGDALWFIGNIFDDDFFESTQDIHCDVLLNLGRSSGPQEWGETWVNNWNFALEEAYGSRPSFCQSTSFDELEYEFNDAYSYSNY